MIKESYPKGLLPIHDKIGCFCIEKDDAVWVRADAVINKIAFGRKIDRSVIRRDLNDLIKL